MICDSHLHLDQMKASEQTILLAKAGRQKCFLNPAIDPDHWPAIAELVQRHPAVVGCVGVHPWRVEQAEVEDPSSMLQEMARWLQQHPDFFVGEIGLDFFQGRARARVDRQIAWCAGQLALAKQFERPIIIHCRRAHDEMWSLLQTMAISPARVVWHGISASWEEAKRYVDCGMKLGIGPTLLNPRALRLQTLVQRAPLAALLLESDAPFGWYEKYQSRLAATAEKEGLKLAVPDMIRAIATQVSNLKSNSLLSQGEVLLQLQQNTLTWINSAAKWRCEK